MEKKNSTQRKCPFAGIWMFVSILALGIVNLNAQSTSPTTSCNTKLSWTTTSNQINFKDSLLGPVGYAHRRLIKVKYSNGDSTNITNVSTAIWSETYIFSGNQYAIVTISDTAGCTQSDSIVFVSSGVLCANRTGCSVGITRLCDSMGLGINSNQTPTGFNFATFDSVVIDYGDSTPFFVKKDLGNTTAVHKYNSTYDRVYSIKKHFYYKDGCVKTILDSFAFTKYKKPGFFVTKNFNKVYLTKTNNLGNNGYYMNSATYYLQPYDSFTFAQKGVYPICLKHNYPGTFCYTDSCINVTIDSVLCSSAVLFNIPIEDSCGYKILRFDFKNFNASFDSVKVNFGDGSAVLKVNRTDSVKIKAHTYPSFGVKYTIIYTYFLTGGCSRFDTVKHTIKTTVKNPFSITKHLDTVFLTSPNSIGNYAFSNGDWLSVNTSNFKVFNQKGNYNVCRKRFDLNDSFCYKDSCISFTIDSLSSQPQGPSNSPVVSCNTKLSWTITSNQINFTDTLLGPWGNANKRKISVKYSNGDSLNYDNIGTYAWSEQFIFAGNQYAVVTISDSVGCTKIDSIVFVSSGIICANRIGINLSLIRLCDSLYTFISPNSSPSGFNLSTYDSLVIDFGDSTPFCVKKDISITEIVHKYNSTYDRTYFIKKYFYYKDGCAKMILDSFKYTKFKKWGFTYSKNFNKVYLYRATGQGSFSYNVDGNYYPAHTLDSFVLTKGLHSICLKYGYPFTSCYVDSCITISIDSIQCNGLSPGFDIFLQDSCSTNVLIFDFSYFNMTDSVKVDFGDSSPTYTRKASSPYLHNHAYPNIGQKYTITYTFYTGIFCPKIVQVQRTIKTASLNKPGFFITKNLDTVFLNSSISSGYFIFSNGVWEPSTLNFKVFNQKGNYSVCLRRMDLNDTICYLDSCISFTIDSIQTCSGYNATFTRNKDTLFFARAGNAITRTISYIRTYRDNVYLQKSLGSKVNLIVTDTLSHVYRHEVVFDDSCKVIKYDTATIKLNLINLDFTFTITNNFVNFVNTTTNGSPNIVYYWEFGDTSMEYAYSTSHVYKKVGLHNVCLNAIYNQSSSISKICKSVNIANVIPIKDLSITLNTGSRIVGWDIYDSLRAKNKGITTESGNYYYKYNSKMTFVSSSPAPTSHNAATRLLTYTFNNWAPLASQVHNLHFYVDSFATAGTIVCDSVWIAPNTNDVNLSNNLVSHCGTLLGSYDPNEKIVDHEGDYDYKVAKTLTYEVGFQNTGSAPAKNIAIVDQLDKDLDWSTFKMIGSSHEYSAKIDDGGALIVRYQNIYLPDSFSNEPASHGHFTYTIDIAADKRILGTEIENTANIFFDWNLPIQTNTVKTKLAVKKLNVSNLSTEPNVSIYPNPIADILYVNAHAEKVIAIQIHDVLGNVLNIPAIEQYNQLYKLNTSNLNKGLYFISIQTDRGRHIERVMKE